MNRSIPIQVQRELYRRSNGYCYFPGCNQKVNFPETATGAIAHIIAFSPRGPRGIAEESFDRHDVENLMILCSEHHPKVDNNPGDFPVETLVDWKRSREQWVRAVYSRIEGEFDNDLFHQYSDLITPNVGSQFLVPIPSLDMDRHVVSRLTILGEAAIEAAIFGDYDSFICLGKRIWSEATAIKNKPLQALGKYLEAEGVRLTASLRRDSSSSIRRKVLDLYETAREFDPTSPRTIRGVGKAHQDAGNIDRAEKLYRLALDTALMMNESAGGHQALFQHEALRSSRHAISNALSKRHTLSEKEKLVVAKHLGECVLLHRLWLPQYNSYPFWHATESFMGYTFIGSAAASLKMSEASSWLATAIRNRIRIMESGPPSVRDLENIEWWASAVRVALRGRRAATARSELERIVDNCPRWGLDTIRKRLRRMANVLAEYK